MKLNYNPSSEIEKFAIEIDNLIAEKFPQTFFVGGVVRDLLLQREIKDIDIATQAQPEQVIECLNAAGIKPDTQGQQFGVILARRGELAIEIATFRAEQYGESRFPKVRFITTPEEDSLRRDFTINALYLNQSTGEVLDYHNGLNDLDNKTLRFIGDAQERIKEDPLRIVRAYRFKLSLNFNFDTTTEQVLTNSFKLIKTLSEKRIESEINKISNDIVRQELRKVIHKFT